MRNGKGHCRRRALAPLTSLIAMLALGGIASAAGTVVFDGSAGTRKPPRWLQGKRMQQFARDRRKLGGNVTRVTGPTGAIIFDHPLSHGRARSAWWRTWSNRYRGDVYFTYRPVTIRLPAGTTAFYLYAEPNDGLWFDVTARTTGATSGRVRVNGLGGAKFFGFVAAGGATLTTITVSSSDTHNKKRHLAGGFAIGEFGIHKG